MLQLGFFQLNFKNILGASAFLFFGATVSAQAGLPLWVDISDVSQYSADSDEANTILGFIENNPESYAPENFFSRTGLFVQKRVESAKEINYLAVSRLGHVSGGDIFRKFQIRYDKATHEVIDFTPMRDIPMEQTAFSINVGLIQREVLVEDLKNDIRMLFPLGVGGVDEGVLYPGYESLLTPLFHHASIKRNTIDLVVNEPTYYRGLPFLPITNAAGHTTFVAFHISILADEEWADQDKGGSFIYRGFVSHGCMRLRKHDLQNLTEIVVKSAAPSIPVDVDYFIVKRIGNSIGTRKDGPLQVNHPYPLMNSEYETVQNFAKKGEHPQSKRDPLEKLLILKTVGHAPNFTQLDGFDEIDRVNLEKFSSQTGMR